MGEAWYNEIDPKAAAWLRELIKRGLIAPGVVDERSIEDIRPAELAGFTQCHFFAGIGVWSYALRSAGWPDSRPVWTGSCPCQPFSQAGKGAGTSDERHLWPSWFHLIGECRPTVVFGEQVASKAADSWADLVQDDLEAVGYAFGAVPFPAASVGAPHIRDRLYWMAVADATERRPDAARGHQRHGQDAGRAQGAGDAQRRGGNGRLADDDDTGRIEHTQRDGEPQRGQQARPSGDDVGGRGELGDADFSVGRQGRALDGRRHSGSYALTRAGLGGPSLLGELGDDDDARLEGRSVPAGGRSGERTPWSASDFVWCRDEKWRPVEPCPQPLVDGSARSLGPVRAERIAQIDEEINASPMESEIRAGSILREVLETARAQAQRCWPARGLPRLHEAPFLLAFMRQLAAQGWQFAKGVSLPCEEASAGRVRMLRNSSETASSPCGRELAEQRPGKSANTVHFLSQLLARHAQAEWHEAYGTHAEIGFPLTHSARSRVARLRGYGNAIVAYQAQVFVEESGLL